MEQSIVRFDGAPLAKANQKQVAEGIINAIFEGEVDLLRLDVTLKSIEDTIKLIRKNVQVRELTIAEAEKYASKLKTFDAFGAAITISQKRTWDFASANDPVWNDLNAQEEEIKAKRKSREKLLVAITEGNDVVIPETGEFMAPPKCKATEYLTIKIS